MAGGCRAAGTSSPRKSWEGASGAPKRLRAGRTGGVGVSGDRDGAHLEVRDTGLPGHSLLLGPGGSAASENAPGSCGWSSRTSSHLTMVPQSFRDHQRGGRCPALSIPARFPVRHRGCTGSTGITHLLPGRGGRAGQVEGDLLQHQCHPARLLQQLLHQVDACPAHLPHTLVSHGPSPVHPPGPMAPASPKPSPAAGPASPTPSPATDPTDLPGRGSCVLHISPATAPRSPKSSSAVAPAPPRHPQQWLLRPPGLSQPRLLHSAYHSSHVLPKSCQLQVSHPPKSSPCHPKPSQLQLPCPPKSPCPPNPLSCSSHVSPNPPSCSSHVPPNPHVPSYPPSCSSHVPPNLPCVPPNPPSCRSRIPPSPPHVPPHRPSPAAPCPRLHCRTALEPPSSLTHHDLLIDLHDLVSGQDAAPMGSQRLGQRQGGSGVPTPRRSPPS